MSSGTPTTVIAIYRIAAGKEDEFFELLRRHHPTLHQKGLVTSKPPTVYRGTSHDGRSIAVEIFEWTDALAAEVAQRTPEVMEIWQAMEKTAEAREGRPSMEFLEVDALDVLFETV